MIELQRDQMVSLTRGRREDFLETLTSQLSAVDPTHAKQTGADGMRAVAHLAMDRGAAYGITQKDALRLYGTLMLRMGSYFDVDPALPWTQRGLTAPLDSVTTQVDRVNMLNEDFQRWRTKVHGPQGKHFTAFVAACQIVLTQGHCPVSDGDLAEFARIRWPTRIDAMPPEALDTYLGTSTEVAAEAGLHADLSRFILFVTLLFSGHMAHRDPLHPWLADFLASAARRDDPDALLHRLALRQTEAFNGGQ